MDCNLIQVKPENYCINNFEFDRLYSDKLMIRNIAQFPIILNIRSSDKDKLIISQKLIKMNAGQTVRINFSLKVHSKISAVKDFYIMFHNEMIDMKYNIHIQGRSPKINFPAIYENNLTEVKEVTQDNHIHFENNCTEQNQINVEELIERNQQLVNMVEYYRGMLGPKQLEVEKCINFEISRIKSESDLSIVQSQDAAIFNKQIIQIRYDHYSDNKRRYDEVLSILQNIIEENFKYQVRSDMNDNKFHELEEMIAKFIEGINLRISTEDNESHINMPENIETLSKELERLEKLSREIIDMRITNLKLISENTYLKNNSSIENKNSTVFLNKLKQLENDLEYFKKENTNKISLMNTKDNLLYKKDEEIKKLQITIDKLSNRQTQHIDTTLHEEKENIIRILKQHISQRDRIIESFKERDINPNNTLINSLKLELKQKEKIISELCGQQDINSSKY
jgi:hypothetical protein